MSLFVRVVAAALLLVVIVIGAYFAGFRLLRPTTAYAVVEETTPGEYRVATAASRRESDGMSPRPRAPPELIAD